MKLYWCDHVPNVHVSIKVEYFYNCQRVKLSLLSLELSELEVYYKVDRLLSDDSMYTAWQFQIT